MGCGEFLVKYILFFANLVFALAGIALIGLGIAVQLQISEVVNVIEGNYEVAPITSMVVGSIVFIIAFFGCCGAIRESNCMLVTYSIFMILLMLVKVTLAILIFVNLNDYKDGVSKWLTDAFNRDRTGFQNIERTFKCCGPLGAGSYLNVMLPDTCCDTQPCSILNAFPGCATTIEDFFQTFGVAIGSIAIVVAALELVAVVFALCLANHARNEGRRSRY